MTHTDPKLLEAQRQRIQEAWDFAATEQAKNRLLKNNNALLGALIGDVVMLRTQFRKQGQFDVADAIKGVLTRIGIDTQDAKVSDLG